MTTDFTPVASLIGGALIGIAAVILMLTLGRIMGATGILAGAILPQSRQEWRWKIAVIIGMLCGPWLFRLLHGAMPEINTPNSPAMIIIGGFIVGIGVTLGSGCTSGHGVCGIARLSPRSIIAVITFMISTAITVFVTRHVLEIGA